MKITVLGSGAWGTALALLLLENGHRVSLWSYNRNQADELRNTRENPLLKGVMLPGTLEITTELDTISDSQVVVVVTPSFAVRSTVRMIAPLLTKGTVLVTASKGVEKDTSLCFTQILEQELGEGFPVVALSGPSHAEEVGRGIPTGCVAASRDGAAAELVQDVFMNSHFRVYTNSDVMGVELGAALKNVLALCCGISDGMGLGDNTKALLMIRGMAEMARLGVAMGGQKETFAGLSGMGDLIVTCTSMHSRNRRCGILIGQGVPVEEAIARVGATVEGYFAAYSAHQMAEKLKVDMPICRCAYEILYRNVPVAHVVELLMNRPQRHEADKG